MADPDRGPEPSKPGPDPLDPEQGAEGESEAVGIAGPESFVEPAPRDREAPDDGAGAEPESADIEPPDIEPPDIEPAPPGLELPPTWPAPPGQLPDPPDTALAASWPGAGAPLAGALVPVAPAPEPAPAATGSGGDDKVMSLVDHLGELRTRIFRALLGVAIFSVVGLYFSTQIRAILIAPLPTGQVQVLGPGDAFFITLKISIIAGVILSMPWILYQAWAFIAPGLTVTERRAVRPWVPLALLFFALGVVIAYLVLPYATTFLLSFTDNVLVANIAAGPYFDFVTTMFLAFGLVMEFPILLFALARVGVIGSAQLKASRRYVLLGTTVFAAIITPGGDLVSPLVLGVTMYVMYEATIFVIARTGR